MAPDTTGGDGVKRLGDAAFARHARAYAATRATIRELEAEAKRNLEHCVAELEARGRKDLTLAGLRVVMKRRTSTVYDPVAARERWKPSIFRRTRTTVIDREAVRREVAAGRLTEAEANAVATTSRTEPWLVVTEETQREAAA